MNVFKKRIKKPDGTVQESENWYVRLRRGGRDRWICLDTPNRKDAERRARDLAKESGDAFETYRRAVQLRQTITIGTLAERWMAAGLPDASDRPREAAAAARVRAFLEKALPWWGPRNPNHITLPDLRAYAAHRRTQVQARRGPEVTGDRAVDLELNSLSLLCDWARGHGLQANPFLRRPRFRAPEHVRHCHLDMPASADELDRIAEWLIGQGDTGSVVAAQLLLQAFTGLRPGEPGALRWHAQPGQPGHLYTVTRDGQTQTLLQVQRQKHGINPAVKVHADLQRLLTAWSQYSVPRWGDGWMFPNPSQPDRPLVPYSRTADSQLSKWLTRATAALELPRRRPHAMRAFYVRVRRAQDIDDALIGSELGERTGASLVVATYGEPTGIRGDGRFTWTPTDRLPCWTRLWSRWGDTTNHQQQ